MEVKSFGLHETHTLLIECCVALKLPLPHHLYICVPAWLI